MGRMVGLRFDFDADFNFDVNVMKEGESHSRPEKLSFCIRKVWFIDRATRQI